MLKIRSKQWNSKIVANYVLGKGRGTHVRVDQDPRGNATTVDGRQLLRKGYRKAVVQTKTSVLWKTMRFISISIHTQVYRFASKLLKIIVLLDSCKQASCKKCKKIQKAVYCTKKAVYCTADFIALQMKYEQIYNLRTMCNTNKHNPACSPITHRYMCRANNLWNVSRVIRTFMEIKAYQKRESACHSWTEMTNTV